jgi:undecaprenyl-diphosphatase
VIGLILFLFGCLVFGALFYNLRAQGPLLAWDQSIANTLPAIGLNSPPFVKVLMNAGFYIGDQVLVGFAVLLGIYFIIKRYWQEFFMVALGLGGASLLFLSLSNWIGRARPLTQIWIFEKIPGFPSGHAISVVAFYGLLAYFLVPKITSAFGKAAVVVAALLVIGFVGFSRVFTGGHYLTDVLAGFAVGLAWSGAIYTLIELYFQKRRSKNVKKE